MKRLLAGIALSVAAVVATAGIKSEKPAPNYRVELPAMVRKADRAKVRYYTGRKEAVAEVFDAAWLEQIAVVLAESKPKRADLCFCISYPMIELYEGDKQLASISVHHAERLRFLGKGFGGDFLVGKEVGAKISKLAEMKKGLLPMPKPDLPPLELAKPELTPYRVDKSGLPATGK